MNPTEEITTAAARLRELARAAGGGTWTADHFPEGTIVRPAGSTRSLLRLAADGNRAAGTPYVPPAIGDYIAAMGPLVGTAVALLLDRTPSSSSEIGHEECTSWCNPEICDVSAALTLARQINAGSQT